MAQPIALYGKYFNAEALADYLIRRRNPDGGFCFYSLDESSLNDTFYASLILAALGRTPAYGRTPRKISSARLCFPAIATASSTTPNLISYL